MKAVILCGGKGTRMREETEYRPKPLVNIGGRPIIWHIMKTFSHFGITDFVLCVGYKGEMIKQYFMEMYWRNNDFTIHFGHPSKVSYHTETPENWNVTIVDTGLETMTAGRLKKVMNYIDGEDFLFTYGDGLSDVNIKQLIAFHQEKQHVATLTGVFPLSPFGLLEVDNHTVHSFREKPVINDMINGGYMVLNRKVFDYFPIQDCYFEQEPLMKLAQERQLAVFEHRGFWTSIDTFKDIEKVNQMWESGNHPWRVWGN
ncbi:glucose-1-phosphate cytidylyltransferase [Cohnella abietis]|uniref:Putative glucose-1-phosphate cytidylyltransferase n=1 Tax=Cohnella abietis TaxID=2507935 RepID=A0A3T1DDM4_9BACL|nr:glucose-1-phosphate cytidylyltransferase [Cohnella abietis]BBI36134.1 putative glucose-1-phosphate cytidylyltransferase [Cohnella abietis]